MVTEYTWELASAERLPKVRGISPLYSPSVATYAGIAQMTIDIRRSAPSLLLFLITYVFLERYNVLGRTICASPSFIFNVTHGEASTSRYLTVVIGFGSQN